MIVKMHQAKSQLSKLIAAVEAGEEVSIARGDKVVAKLVPVDPPAKPRRVPGRYKGQFEVTDAFFEPLPQEELALWEGKDD
jgi:antitoxin (DNA-binding transcriptional repressor) of toxin-antitoxin stability system